MQDELIKIANFLSYRLRTKNNYTIINKHSLEQTDLSLQEEKDISNFFLSSSPVKPKNKHTWYLILSFLAANKSLPKTGNNYRSILSDFELEAIELLRKLSVFPHLPEWEQTLKELNNPLYWVECYPPSGIIPSDANDLTPYFPNFRVLNDHNIPIFYIPIRWFKLPDATLIALYINHILTYAPNSNIEFIRINNSGLPNSRPYYIPPNFKEVLRSGVLFNLNHPYSSELLERILSLY